MDRPSMIRRIAGLCMTFVAALTLAAITTTPAAAQAATPQVTASAPTVVNPGDQKFAEFSSVHLQMTATGGSPQYTWSATGLGNWLSINPSTGLISGIAAPGIRMVTVTATDTAGLSGSATFKLTVPLECRTC